MMEYWGAEIYLRLSHESRYVPTRGWGLGIHLAAVADRRYWDYPNFTILHGAIVARYWKKRLRTVRTIFWSKKGVQSLHKPL
jgi:hypothetical protein